MIVKDMVNDILGENDFLTSENSNYRSYCQELADFILPRKAWINSIRTKGERVKFNFLYDTTGILALRTLAAGFYSNLTNESTRWFALETRNKQLMKRHDVRTYWKETEDIIFDNLRASNYYNVIQEFFIDYGGFGTGTFSMLEDSLDKVRFEEMPVKQINRVVDGTGRLSAIYRNFKLTARQAFKLWKEDAGESILKSLEKKPFEEFEFLHYVGERFEREAGKSGSLNMPYKSLWINKKDKHLIGEGGFMEMPYISEVFYKDANDPNGFSPAMDVFALVKLVNAMMRTVIRGAMKQSDPPYVLPSKGFILPLNLNPAATNFRDPKTPNDALQVLPVGNGRIDIGVEMIELVQRKIEEGMFVPLFRSLSEITKQMTIPEVQRRIAEGMALLGPVVSRCNHGVLSPMIIRIYNILNRNQELPDPPEILQGEDFSPVYLSTLAKAQRQSEVTEIQTFLGDVQAIGTILPNALDKVDEDKTIDVLHRVRGITPEILRDEETLERKRKHREEQNAMVAALQAGQGMGAMTKDMAGAQKASAEAMMASQGAK